MAGEIELGTKHECPSCGVKYYDFGKSDVPCPKCGAPEEEAEEEAKGAGKKS